jgi:site-specific DNA recombinase
MEARQKSVRQKAAAMQKAQLGKPAGGPRAFGFERDGVTVREAEATALRAAYAALLVGRSMVGIARDLDTAGFLTARLGKRFNHSAARAVLVNPRNAGLRAYRGEIVGPAAWPAIVDEETWRAAHAILTDSARHRGPGSSARKWLLGGLALCGRCDDGATVKVTYRGERNAKRELIRAYRCSKSSHLTREAGFCDWRVTERVIARLSRDDARDLLIDDDREDLAELRQQQATLRLRLDQLADEYGNSDVTLREWQLAREPIKARLADLDARVVHVDRAPLLADLVTAQDVRKTWEGIALDRQRAVVDLLYTVTLLPRGPGRKPAPLESVRMEPKA